MVKQLLLGILLLSPVLGCAAKANVKGKVTFDGKPVARGGIVIASPDGEADKDIGRASIAADGTYRIVNLVPGKKRVQVAAFRLILPASEATERLPPPVPDFPDDAEGNGQIIELRPGENEVDIHLTKSAQQ